MKEQENIDVREDTSGYKKIYTIREVAAVLRINVNAVYDLMDQRRLPYIKLGSRKVKGIDLKKFIEEYPTENV